MSAAFRPDPLALIRQGRRKPLSLWKVSSMDDSDPPRRQGGTAEGEIRDTPRDVARRLKSRSQAQARAEAQRAASSQSDGFVRQTYALPREEARVRAQDWFQRYPKAAYMTRVESWRQLQDGRIEFTMRRLPTAD